MPNGVSFVERLLISYSGEDPMRNLIPVIVLVLALVAVSIILHPVFVMLAAGFDTLKAFGG